MNIVLANERNVTFDLNVDQSLPLGPLTPEELAKVLASVSGLIFNNIHIEFLSCRCNRVYHLLYLTMVR